MPKLIVIGIDGATWELLKPLIKEGELPNFAKLVKNGCIGTLKSTFPATTPPSWTSISTGKNPGKHNIFNFVSYNSNSTFSLTTSKEKRAKEIWDYLEGSYKSIVLNLPFSFPVRRIDGIMVSGMLTPSINSNFALPERIKNYIKNEFPDYRFNINWQEYNARNKDLKKLVFKATHQRIRLLYKLMDNERWDLLFVVFVGSDRLQHLLWGTKILVEYYQLLDDTISTILKKIGKQSDFTLFLVSDHGFHKVEREFYINTYLKNKGYITTANNNSTFLSKLGITRERILRIVSKKCVEKILEKYPKMREVGKKIPGNTKYVQLDMEVDKSLCFMRGYNSLYINKKFKKFLPKEEIQKFGYKLKEMLLNLKDEEGKKVFRHVFLKNEIYTGPYIGNAPDLVLNPNRGIFVSPHIVGQNFGIPTSMKATHDPNGIFLAYGSDIKQGIKLQDTQVYDIAPTILHIFGLPVPDDMDGRVLTEIFKEDSEPARRKVKYQKVGREKGKIKEKIRKLRESGKI